jgi:hypothetical protein
MLDEVSRLLETLKIVQQAIKKLWKFNRLAKGLRGSTVFLRLGQKSKTIY